MRWSRHLVAVIPLLGLGKAWAGGECRIVETATKLYARGVELATLGDLPGALEAFKDAYVASPCFKVLYNIGQVQIELGQPQEAHATLLRFLREGQSRIRATRRRHVERQVKQLEAFLGELEVTTEPTGASISVDGDPIGRTRLAEPIWLAADRHEIVASREGFQSVQRTIVIGQGKQHEVHLQLPPVGVNAQANRAAAIVTPVPDPTPERSRLRATLPYALVGAGAVLGGVALGVYLGARDSYERWGQLNGKLRGDLIGSNEYKMHKDERDGLTASLTHANRTILGLTIAGGVLLVTGASWYAFDRMSARRSSFTLAWGGGASVAAGWRCSW